MGKGSREEICVRPATVKSASPTVSPEPEQKAKPIQPSENETKLRQPSYRAGKP